MFTRLLSATLGLFVLLSQSHADPAAAPEGFLWEYSETLTYTASFSNSRDMGASSDVNGGAAVMTLGESIFLPTFDASSGPGTQAYCVLSSVFSVSLDAVAEATLFNITAASDDFSGVLSLSNFSIGVDGVAGPATDTLLRSDTPISIESFGSVAFSDQTTGATSALIGLSDSGVAPTDGSSILFDFTGTMGALFTSASGVSGGSQFFGAPAVANYEASVETTYDIYNLTVAPAVPEPSAGLLIALGCVGLIAPRRRTASSSRG